MALTTLAKVAITVKAILSLLILLLLSTGSFGIFGSDAYKSRVEPRDRGFSLFHDSKHKCEQAFVTLSVLSFLVCCATLIPHFLPYTVEKKKLWIILGDISLCTLSAVFLLIGGSLLTYAMSTECQRPAGSTGRRWERKECFSCMDVSSCLEDLCVKEHLTPVKMAVAVISLLIALLCFWVPCGLALKVHKKQPQNAETAMGGNVEQPGGVYGGVVTGAPPGYQMYVVAPPEYQAQYGGGYVYETQQLQMVPSQNPAVAYPPPQGGVPQYAIPQGGEQN